MFFTKSPAEIEIMAEAGRRLGEILAKLQEEVRSGVRTDALDRKSFQLIREAGCEPAFLNYRPTWAKKSYPATLCVSVNDVIVHGVPSERIIKDGDIVKLDLGLKYKGLYVDAAITVFASLSRERPLRLARLDSRSARQVGDEARSGGVGSIDAEKKKLIAAARNALELGIKQALPGKTLGDIGYAIQKSVNSEHFSIIEGLTGHGIGRELHEEPVVYNFGRPEKGERLKAGMVIAIEPMISAAPPPGGGKIKQLEDESFATADGSLSAHFEHTVAITENGPRVLTRT